MIAQCHPIGGGEEIFQTANGHAHCKGKSRISPERKKRRKLPAVSNGRKSPNATTMTPLKEASAVDWRGAIEGKRNLQDDGRLHLHLKVTEKKV